MAATIVPAAMGHSERFPIPGDASGYPGPAAGSSVSGRYVGAAGPAVAIEAYSNPQGTLATGGMVCDAEVAVDSNVAPDNAANEPKVDGAFGGTSPAGEVWDDGGNGGACHTHHYSTGTFNTFGCQPGTRAAGGTHAGTDIWVGASCDWKEEQGGQSGEVTLVLCIVNGILALNVGNIVNDVLTLAQCVLDYVACLLDPTGCVVDGIPICGADGTSDAIIYGYAGVGATLAPANFPTLGVGQITNGNPPVTTTCPSPTSETASVFVWDTVATNNGLPEVYPALTGEIWTAPGLPGGGSNTQCSDGVDNDGDLLADASDYGCWDNPTDPNSYNPDKEDEAKEPVHCKITRSWAPGVGGAPGGPAIDRTAGCGDPVDRLVGAAGARCQYAAGSGPAVFPTIINCTLPDVCNGVPAQAIATLVIGDPGGLGGDPPPASVTTTLLCDEGVISGPATDKTLDKFSAAGHPGLKNPSGADYTCRVTFENPNTTNGYQAEGICQGA